MMYFTLCRQMAFLAILSLTAASCMSDFAAGPSIDLDGYSGYPTVVAPIADIGTPETKAKDLVYTGPFFEDESCRGYKVNGDDAKGFERELTALFSGVLSFPSQKPMANASFTVTTRLQFFENCNLNPKKSDCTASHCCPDGYLSLNHSWFGKTEGNGKFSLPLAFSPLTNWQLVSSEGGKNATNLYFMHTADLTLLKFDYDIQFKSDSLSSAQCAEVCQNLDVGGASKLKGDSCVDSCVSGSFTIQSETVDLLNSSFPCPEKTSLYRIGKIAIQAPVFYSVKDESTGKQWKFKMEAGVGPASESTPTGN